MVSRHNHQLHPPLLTASQSSEPGQLVTTTVRDYDLAETSKLVSILSPPSFPTFLPPPPQLRSVYMGIAMMAFMHGYLKYTQPLFIQGLMGIKNLYDAKPVAIHVLGRPAEGDLKRPFASAASLFGGGKCLLQRQFSYCRSLMFPPPSSYSWRNPRDR
jgi:hypothetical protein